MRVDWLLAIADESLMLARHWIDDVFTHKTPPNSHVSEMIHQQLKHALAMLDYWITFFPDEIEMEFVRKRQEELNRMVRQWSDPQPAQSPAFSIGLRNWTEEEKEVARKRISEAPLLPVNRQRYEPLPE